jgi:small nuclear ribonucleoprotein (snRNP)-like protein
MAREKKNPGEKPKAASEPDAMARLVGSIVVLDTSTPYVYLGTLKESQEHCLVLTDADVRDISEGHSGKELYILEARRNGIQKNRNEVMVRRSLVVSISRIDDVVLF